MKNKTLISILSAGALALVGCIPKSTTWTEKDIAGNPVPILLPSDRGFSTGIGYLVDFDKDGRVDAICYGFNNKVCFIMEGYQKAAGERNLKTNELTQIMTPQIREHANKLLDASNELMKDYLISKERYLPSPVPVKNN